MSLFLSKLRKLNQARTKEWNGSLSLEDISFHSNELGGECGEAQNGCKKLDRFLKNMKGGVNIEDSKTYLESELADIIICVDKVAMLLDIDLEPSIIKKFNETSDQNGLKTKFFIKSNE